jgi:hypothetical protein
MKIRATLLLCVKVGVIATMATGCWGGNRKILADAPQILPYQAPDISEITGIEEPDTDSDSDEGSAAAPAPEPGK